MSTSEGITLEYETNDKVAFQGKASHILFPNQDHPSHYNHEGTLDFTIETTGGLGGFDTTVTVNENDDPHDLIDVDPTIALTSSNPVKSLDQILQEYYDRAVLLNRLLDQLAETTDPSMQSYLQDQIATQQEILGVLSGEALDAGATQQQLNDLNDLNAQATAEAAGNPIEWVEIEPESWAESTIDVLIGASVGAGHGLAMFGNAATFHQTPLSEYVNNFVEENGGLYGTANVFAHIGAYAAESVVLIYGYSVFINPTTLYHFTSSSAANSIAASGQINMGGGLFGQGVYASSINNAFIATLMGAQSTEAVIVISAATVKKYPTLIPGAWRIIHNVLRAYPKIPILR